MQEYDLITRLEDLQDRAGALSDDRILLEKQLANSSDRLKGAFSVALGNVISQQAGLTDEYEGLLGDPENAAHINDRTQQMLADATVLQGLREKGHLSSEQAEEELRKVYEHPDFELLRQINRTRSDLGVEAVKVAAEVVEVPEAGVEVQDHAEEDDPEHTSAGFEHEEVGQQSEDTDSLPGTEIERVKEVTLTIIKSSESVGTILRVGAMGRRIKLRGRQSADVRDYTPERLAALKALCDAGELNIVELKEAIAAETNADKADIKKEVMTQVRHWLESITFNKTPLFAHNGKKGYGSRYSVTPGFDLSVVEQEITNERHDIPSLREATVVARFLDDSAMLLEALGLPALTPNVAAWLADSSDTQDSTEGIARGILTEEDIVAEREAALAKFQAAMTEDDIFDAFYALLEENDPKSDLVNYLVFLDEDMWGVIREQVLNARHQIEQLFADPIGPRGSRAHIGTMRTITLPNGRQFIQENVAGSKPSFREVPLTRLNSDPEEDVDLPASLDGIVGATALEGVSNEDSSKAGIGDQAVPADAPRSRSVDAEPEGTVSSTTSRRPRKDRNRSRRPSPEEVKSQLNQAVGEFLTLTERHKAVFDGKLSMRAVGGLMNFSTRIATEEALTRLEQVNIRLMTGDRKGSSPMDVEISLADTAIMYVLNQNRDLFGGTKRQNQQAEKIVRDAVASFLKAREE